MTVTETDSVAVEKMEDVSVSVELVNKDANVGSGGGGGRSSVTVIEGDKVLEADGTAVVTVELPTTGTTASLVTIATLVLVTSTTSVEVGAGASEVIVTRTVLVASGAEWTIVEMMVSVLAGGVTTLVVSFVCTMVVWEAVGEPPSTGTTEYVAFLLTRISILRSGENGRASDRGRKAKKDRTF